MYPRILGIPVSPCNEEGKKREDHVSSGFFLCWASLFCCLTGIAVFETAAMESAHRRDCADTGGSSSDVVLINVKSPHVSKVQVLVVKGLLFEKETWSS